jgi:hypothetical protein
MWKKEKPKQKVLGGENSTKEEASKNVIREKKKWRDDSEGTTTSYEVTTTKAEGRKLR